MPTLTGIITAAMVDRITGKATCLLVPIELKNRRIVEWRLWAPTKCLAMLRPDETKGGIKGSRLTPWFVQTFWADKLPEDSWRVAVGYKTIKRLGVLPLP